MAEQEEGSSGGGNTVGKLKALLGKKVGGVPVWIIVVIGILILAYFMKKNNDAKAASKDNTDTLSDLVGSSTFPFGQPMNYSSDIFINTRDPDTTVQNPTNTPTTTTPDTVTAQAGWNLNDWVNDLNKMGIKTSVGELNTLNPGFINNVSTSGPSANTFKQTQTYKLK